MALIHSFVMGLGGGNAIYAAKAGALTSKANDLFNRSSSKKLNCFFLSSSLFTIVLEEFCAICLW